MRHLGRCTPRNRGFWIPAFAGMTPIPRQQTISNEYGMHGAITLIHHFREHFSRSDDIAYVDRRGLRTVRRSYKELGQLAEQWAQRLSERNIAKGDRVLLWAENSAQW